MFYEQQCRAPWRVAQASAVLLILVGQFLGSSSAYAALSTGCQSINSIGSANNVYDKYWQEVNNPLFTFSSGETLKVTFSNPRAATTAHIMVGTSAAPGVAASYTSKTSTTTFPATLTYTLDQNYTYVGFETTAGSGVGSGSGANVDMVFECGIAQTITFANPGDQELPTGTVNLTATSDSGLPVTLTSTTLPVCTVSGTTLSLVDEGTCTITASQSGSGDYFAADDVERSFMVTSNDPDGDGVEDSLDNCPAVANADQLDTDSDGTGNACDTDDDDDGTDDGPDNCPLVSNADQLDTDSDGMGNACDTDDDDDGTDDGPDNCPLVSNADQLDTDSDGTGNACDNDDDGDGTDDGPDNCPLISNADQLDTDSDGIGDACETSTFDNDHLAVPVPTVPTLWLILGAILIALQGGSRRRPQ